MARFSRWDKSKKQMAAYRRRRARARNLLRRVIRRRRRRRRGRPSVRSLAKSVRNLYKRDDKKFFYLADPDTPVNNVANFTVLGSATALNSCPAADAAITQSWMKREPLSVECNLKTIRIHMLVEKHLNSLDRNRHCPYYIMLIKTTNKIGAAGGITYPDLDEVFDPAGAPVAGNRLSRFDSFRNVQGPGSETLQNTKVLKVWSGTLQSAGYQERLALDTTGTSTDAPPNPGGTIVSDGGAGAPTNCNYTSTYPNKVLIKYTHRCNNALVKFDSATGATAMNPINNHYYLLACAGYGATQGVGARDFYNVSTMIKTNFVDN